MKYALSYLVIFAMVLVLLNTYPVVASQDLLFASKRDSLKSQTAVMASALMELESLSADQVARVMNMLDSMGLKRILVTDPAGLILYDSTRQPGEGEEAFAQERCGQIAQEWSAAMQAGRDGAVRDFVCAGDVGIRTIGADNQILDSEVPVRQILEQLVAKTGIPPFLLGLSWSSTERMSSQQADILTSEIAAIRRSLEPVAERVCEWWLRLKGYDDRVKVDWLDVNLQDEESEARAALYRAQARAMEEERQDGDL